MCYTIDRDLKAANERFASVGIEVVKASVTEKVVPTRLTLPQGKLKVDVTGSETRLSQDVKTIIETYGTKDDLSDLHIFYCPFALTGGAFGSNLAGVALNSYFNHADDAGYLSNIFMTQASWDSALSHELGHVLTNAGHLTVLSFPNNPAYQAKVRLNLMSQIPTAEGEVSDSKRLFKTQENQMKASAHAKNP